MKYCFVLFLTVLVCLNCSDDTENNVTEVQNETIEWTFDMKIGEETSESLGSSSSVRAKATDALSSISCNINDYDTAIFSDSIEVTGMNGSVIKRISPTGGFSFSGSSMLIEGSNKLTFSPYLKDGFTPKPYLAIVTLIVSMY